MNITMKDIARDLGVSVVTVSKVVRQHPDISDETRERVLRRMKELSYRPNLTARSLVTGRTFLVGLIVPDLLHPFFAEIAKALSTELRKKNYYLIMASSEEEPELEQQEIDQMLGRRLDALIVAPSSPTAEILRHVQEQSTPFVLIDRRFPGTSANYVGSDDAAVGLLATEHLIQVGCERIAHIRGPENTPGSGRLEGYRKALQKHQRLEVSNYIVAEPTVDVESRERGRDAMRRLLALSLPPDGVFCYNDPIAMGAIDFILESGRRVPEDIAVIGCGDVHYDSSLRVALSSVNQHSREIGEKTGKLVLSLIEASTPPKPRSIILKPEVVQRLSTRRASSEKLASLS